MQWSNRDEGVLIGIRSSCRDAGGPMGTQGSQWGRRGSGGNAGVLRDAGCPTAMREGRGVVPMGTWVHSQGCGGSLAVPCAQNPLLTPPHPPPLPRRLRPVGPSTRGGAAGEGAGGADGVRALPVPIAAAALRAAPAAPACPARRACSPHLTALLHAPGGEDAHRNTNQGHAAVWEHLQLALWDGAVGMAMLPLCPGDPAMPARPPPTPPLQPHKCCPAVPPGRVRTVQEKGNPESCTATALRSGTQRYCSSLQVDVGLLPDPITQPQQQSWLWEGALGPPPELQTSGWR